MRRLNLNVIAFLNEFYCFKDGKHIDKSDDGALLEDFLAEIKNSLEFQVKFLPSREQQFFLKKIKAIKDRLEELNVKNYNSLQFKVADVEIKESELKSEKTRYLEITENPNENLRNLKNEKILIAAENFKNASTVIENCQNCSFSFPEDIPCCPIRISNCSQCIFDSIKCSQLRIHSSTELCFKNVHSLNGIILENCTQIGFNNLASIGHSIKDFDFPFEENSPNVIEF